MSDERENVVVIGETAGCSRDTKDAVLGQVDVLHACADLVRGQVVVEATVIVDGENALVVLDLEMHREWLVAKIAQTSALLLRDSISLKIQTIKVYFRNPKINQQILLFCTCCGRRFDVRRWS